MDIKIFYSKTGFVQSDVFALVRNKRIFMRRKQVISFARGNIQFHLPAYPISTIDISMHLG